jgi:hypothetical protein
VEGGGSEAIADKAAADQAAATDKVTADKAAADQVRLSAASPPSANITPVLNRIFYQP